MKGITWSRDSHGLFDYESRHLTKKTMKTNAQVQIFRKQNELSMLNLGMPLPQMTAPEQEIKPLMNIINTNDTFYLESVSTGGITLGEARDLNEKMYLVVRSLKHNNNKIDYEIQQGDILKVGRVKFAVKEIGISKKEDAMEID